MRSTGLCRGLVALLALAALAGCGGGGETSEQGKTDAGKKAIAPGSNVPGGGRTITATVLTKERKGIPADLGQWMAEIPVDPDGALAFAVTKVVAPRGNTNFRLVNPTAAGHDLTIEEVGAGSIKTPVVRRGSAWVRVSLYAGKRFVYYCSVPGHREAGMEGVIEVDPQLEASDLKPYRAG
jgi:hypothetical protein